MRKVLVCWFAAIALVAGTSLASTGAASASARFVAPQAKKPAIILTAAGIGKFRNGARESTVLKSLTKALGKPKRSFSKGGCEEAANGYNSYATYGHLRLWFQAANSSSKSTRRLMGWEITFAFKGAPKAPLKLDSRIPAGLSLDQLEARYPDGGGLDYMGAWFAEGVLLMPPESGRGTELISSNGSDWCI